MESTDNSSEAGGLSEAFLPGAMQYNVDGGGEEDPEEDAMTADLEPLREQDRFLPIANVAKIMKKSVPNTGKIAKDAKECVQECVSEFISFITSEASERCHREKRKTINGEDILFAMSNLGFDNYVEPLKIYLQKYRESTKGEKGVSTGQEAPTLEELQAEEFGGIGNLTTNILGDQTGQQNVIYTTAFPQQITQQQLNFG